MSHLLLNPGEMLWPGALATVLSPLFRIIEKEEDNTRKQEYKLLLVHGADEPRSVVLEQVRLSVPRMIHHSFHGAIFA